MLQNLHVVYADFTPRRRCWDVEVMPPLIPTILIGVARMVLAVGNQRVSVKLSS